MLGRVLVYEPDLIFYSRIESAGAKLGLETAVVSSLEEFARDIEQRPPALALISLDALKARGESLGALLTGQGCRMIGYYSHVQSNNAEKARGVGFEMVLTRGAFAARLIDILATVGR